MRIFDHDEWTGGQFLTLYIILLCIVIRLGFAIPRYLRARGSEAGAIDNEQAAFLSGGPGRVFDLIVTRLLSARLLALTDDRQIEIVRRDMRRSGAEASILALPSPIQWSAVENALHSHVDALRRGLVAAGLLMDERRAMLVRLCQTLPYLLLLTFGISRWRYGTALDHPTGFLTILLIATIIFTLMRWFMREPRTWSGITAIEEAQARAERLQRAPTADEAVLAVALFGTMVLVGSGWNDFHLMRTNSGHSDNGGGGGCSGGGCGGCGGCGG
ncbi:TIGR04222 domain-containing membrane protein [Sphingobium sp. BYY-5]|uniref:TIGR04222 domain-containing membrane protein n=1 Tax=Sphingobium sp. BYY-5 TaxID=2926400 RepID=UPI001FA7D2D1|nr:TIGR04222 domain-containing membrane protein [Sphingobium sp. BYY-5]MCI4591614.1 TIGR04222 domain-containing membrane protein [Sphingobium sp. BYY-5]